MHIRLHAYDDLKKEKEKEKEQNNKKGKRNCWVRNKINLAYLSSNLKRKKELNENSM